MILFPYRHTLNLHFYLTELKLSQKIETSTFTVVELALIKRDTAIFKLALHDIQKRIMQYFMISLIFITNQYHYA